MENFLNLLFPLTCVFCANLGFAVCPRCLASCRKVKTFHLLRSSDFGMSPGGVLPVYSYFSYEWLVRECIRDSKYKSKKFSLLRDLTKYISLQESFELIRALKFDAIVPIPSTSQKLRRRGFNQAVVIGDILAKALNIPQVFLLKRIKDTQAQHSLSRRLRNQNLQGAFSVVSSQADIVPPKRVLLVDDILTTGSTLWHASVALSDFGVENLYAFTLSRRL